MEIEIKAKKLETIINKATKKAAELKELNGKLENPITLDDIKELTAFYMETAEKLKSAGLKKMSDCYEAIGCILNSWYGDLPKAYKYKKQYIYASIGCNESGEFTLTIRRTECYSGNGVSHYEVYVKDTEKIKNNYRFIISNLL